MKGLGIRVEGLGGNGVGCRQREVEKSKGRRVNVQAFRSPSGLSEAKAVSRGAEGSLKLDARCSKG